jgi:hypothetical protein
MGDIMKFIYILIALFAVWFWFATEPESEVGKLEVKVGPGYSSICRKSFNGYTYDFGQLTYTLCLIDVYGEHKEVNVSKSDFNKAKFGSHGPWKVSRIIRHYEFTYWKNKQ